MINIFSSNEENKKINKDKLNIAFFTDTYLPQINGVSVSVHTLSKELSKNGHNVYVFCPKIKDRDNKDENIIEFISIPFIPYPEHKISMLEVWKAHKYVKKYNIDIIHTHTEFSIGIMGRLTARLLNIPLIYTYHTMYEACIDHVKIKNFEILKPEYARTFSRRFCNFSDYVVAPTKKIHELLNDYGVRKHIKVIPTGINLENFSNVLERDKKQLIEKYSLENKTILSYIGRVSLEKRVDVIVRALKELIKIDKNYHLIIVGDGPDIDKNKQLANDLNLTDFITFVGRVKPEEVALYYNVSDAYISGSLSETQGLTFLEAMASNTPVLASEYTLKDLLIDNETAMLFKTEEDLVGKILKLKDENFKNKLLQNSKQLVSNFSTKQFGQSMEDLYKEAMLDVRKTNNRILILSRLKDEESKKIAFAEKKEYEEKGYVVEVLDISKEYIGLRDYTLKNTLKLENIVKELNLDKVGKPFFELLSSGFKNSIIKKVESYDANVVLATDEEIMRLVYLSKITDEIDITFLTITTKYIKDTL